MASEEAADGDGVEELDVRDLVKDTVWWRKWVALRVWGRRTCKMRWAKSTG